MPKTDFPRCEDKGKFVSMLNDALVECGAERYDYLREQPMEYVRDGCEEFVVRGIRRANVTLDSLPAMLGDIAKAGVI